MNKKIERLITAGMITALVAIFFYQVVYGLDIKSVAKHAFYFRYHDGGYKSLLDIPSWLPGYTPPDHRIITYKTGSEARKTGGLNATTDIADNCNDLHAC
jgi:hypothetical protein